MIGRKHPCFLFDKEAIFNDLMIVQIDVEKDPIKNIGTLPCLVLGAQLPPPPYFGFFVF